MDNEIKVGHGLLGNNKPIVLIAGPCVIEHVKTVMHIAERIVKIGQKYGIPVIFKTSYDKANRTSVSSYRGPGLSNGLKILRRVKKEFKIPILTDIHQVNEVNPVAEVVDILQIPAFLCRQTDLITAAAKSGLPVNVKKGQFLAPWDMQNVVDKIVSYGNKKVMLTERGTCFGYNNLVVDMRSLEEMKKMGYPVIFDATHSVQLPGGTGEYTAGQREFIVPLARAAVAVGIAGLFLEVHPEPEKALSDGTNMLPLNKLQDLVSLVTQIDKVVKHIKLQV